MNPTILYRVSSVLLVLYALAHQMGFRRLDPKWNADGVVAGMKNTSFVVQGMTRSYWDFYSGFGFFVTVLLLFSALLAWQLGAPSSRTDAMLLVRWAFPIVFVVVSWQTWRYFFPAPLIFSIVIALCLALAAWSSRAVATGA